MAGVSSWSSICKHDVSGLSLIAAGTGKESWEVKKQYSIRLKYPPASLYLYVKLLNVIFNVRPRSMIIFME